MAQLERLRVFPVKGFDGVDLDAVEVLNGGTLAHDREYALFDADGDVFNAKRSDRFHRLSTDFDPESGEFRAKTPENDVRRFDLSRDRERAERWFAEYFEADLSLRRDQALGFVDRREMGPSVVSTATLRTVASWFEGMTVEGARRRLRANVELSGVPPFWEDRFLGHGAPSFEVNGVRFEGVTPCGRCVVPQRDPDTGEPLPEFRQQFLEKRRETFPDWADEDAFDHYYAVMIIARVHDADRGRALAVGDTVDVLD